MMIIWDFLSSGRRLMAFWLVGGWLALFVCAAPAADLPLAANQTTNSEFAALGRVVVQLLKDRDVARFATNITINFADLRSILDTNLPPDDGGRLTMLTGTVANERQKFESTGKVLLSQADLLKADFSKGDWQPQIIAPALVGSIHFNNLQAEGQMLSSIEHLEIVLQKNGSSGDSTNGEFKVGLFVLMKFPGGWRAYEGIQWLSFPANAGDEKSRQELTLFTKATRNAGLTDLEDPALRALGEAISHLVATRDTDLFQKEGLLTANLVWKQMQKNGQAGPTEPQLAEQLKGSLQGQVDLARGLIKQMELAGIDFKTAQIRVKAASVDHIRFQNAPGSLAGMVGEHFAVTLTVTTQAKARTGVSESGDYVIVADAIMRFGEAWRVVNNIHWQQFPPGVLDDIAMAQLADAYYAANHVLPPGMLAPNIEVTTLDGEKKMKLSDLRGKVVVLDFWATWCVPCQAPMAALQQLREAHPDWKDRVVIVPLSIDDAPTTARNHLVRRGWTNTFNAWAGEGGFSSPPLQAFRITGVPTTYILDAGGRIVTAGHPAALPIAQIVDGLLKP